MSTRIETLGVDSAARPTPAFARALEWVSTQLALIIPDPPDIRARAPLFAPLMFVLLANVAAAASLQPALVSALSSVQPSIAEATRVWLWLAAFASPALALIKGLLLSLLAWAVIVLLGQEVRFRVLLSINVYAQAILALPGLATAVVLRMRGPAAIQTPQDLIVPQGVDLFIDTAGSPLLMVVAQQGTIFHILWLAFMVWVLPRTTPLSRGASVLVTVAMVAAGLVVAIIRGVALA